MGVLYKNIRLILIIKTTKTRFINKNNTHKPRSHDLRGNAYWDALRPTKIDYITE